jgi:methionine-rich copper-binding protein CopC
VGPVAGVIAMATGWLLATAGPASAHAELAGASPGPGDQVAAGTTIAELSFDRLRADGGARVTVGGPDGGAVPVGPTVQLDEFTVCVAMTPLAPGPHTVTYRVVSADGDEVGGDYRFDVLDSGRQVRVPDRCGRATLPPPATDPVATTTTAGAVTAGGSGSGPGRWVWPAGAGVLIVLVAGGVVLTRRRRRGPG